MATRDPTFALVWQSDQVIFASTSDPSGNNEAYVSIDISTGQVEALGPTLPYPSSVPDAGTDRFTCVPTTDDAGKTTLAITDTQSGKMTSIDGITGQYPACPVEAGQIIFVWQSEDAGILTLSVGPYDQLARVATDLIIHRDLSGADGATFTVLAAKSDAPEALGIFSIDRLTFVTAAVIAPVLGAAAFADGAPPGGPLVSASLSDNFPVLFVGDHFLYGRVMDTGGLLAFVGPVAGPIGPARELALFQFPARSVPNLVPVNQNAFEGLSPALLDDTATGMVLRYWDEAAQRLVSCDLPAMPGVLAGTATQDRRRLLFAVDSTTMGSGATGPLLLVSLDLAAQGGACSLVAAQDVSSSAFSPSSTSMFWVASPVGGAATLWSAAADGSAARKLGAAVNINHVHFVGDARLELTLDTDLAWLDLQEPVPSLHYIAEKVFGDGIDVGDGTVGVGSSLVVGYDFNGQDDTGMLGVVDRDTGAKRAISPAVVWYRLVDMPPVAGSTLARQGVAYLVRGRNPSSQDGLWLATFEPGDLR